MGDASFATVIRRTLGLAFLIAFVLGFLLCVAGVVGEQRVSQTSALLFLGGAFGPMLTMIVHLNLTKALSVEEKAEWRRRLWHNPSSLVTVFFYLLSSDLRRATTELQREQG